MSFNVSAQAGNLLQDGAFDGFYNQGDGSPGAWKPFKITSPGPTIWKHPTEGWPKGPSLWIYGDANQFDGGVYQVVAVSAGKGYHSEVAWAVVRHNGSAVSSDSKLVRQVGIDPFGGSDARSPNIVWSGEYRGNGKFAGDLAVDAHARANQITVFLRARNEYPDSRAEVFFDTVTLAENGAPPIAIAPPTATAAPSATARAATATPLRTRIAIAATAPATFTSAPPSETRAPLATRTPRPTEVPEPENSISDMALPVALMGCLGVGVLGLGAAAFFLLIRKS